ncbi:MAG: hypothetical protein ABSA79_00130 [Candidatus Bathyarchaeia archaeon]
MNHYYRIGKFIWAEAGTPIDVFLLDKNNRYEQIGFSSPKRLDMFLRKKVEQVDIVFFSNTILPGCIEIPAEILGLTL